MKKRTTKKEARVLCLRTCRYDGESYGGFMWPLEVGARVVAPDWNPSPVCGGGLHGLLWGVGGASYLSDEPDANWVVFSADAPSVVDIDGDKVKVPDAVVEFVGAREDAIAYLLANGAAGMPIVFGTATAGDFGTATAGDRGTATAGDFGTATAGYFGTATAGYRGTATAGDFGTATAGDRGTATAGDRGVISILYWDDRKSKWRRAIAEVGENGIEPNVPYRVEGGVFVRADR